METNTHTITSIKEAIEEVQRLTIGRSWISVKELSIGKIFTAHNVKSFSTEASEVLKGKGLMESEGERAGMRFKILSDKITDPFAIAREIAALKTKRNQDYKESVKSDLTPKQPRKSKTLNEFQQGSKVESSLRQICKPTLRDHRFAMIDNKIREVKVIGLSLNEDDFEIYAVQYLADVEQTSTATFYLKDLYEVPEQITDRLLKKIVKL